MPMLPLCLSLSVSLVLYREHNIHDSLVTYCWPQYICGILDRVVAASEGIKISPCPDSFPSSGFYDISFLSLTSLSFSFSLAHQHSRITYTFFSSFHFLLSYFI